MIWRIHYIENTKNFPVKKVPLDNNPKRLFTGTIEQMLESEMDEHLGYDKNSVLGNNSGNSRNGYNQKTIISEYVSSEIAVPRDRNGEFDNQKTKETSYITDFYETFHIEGLLYIIKDSHMGLS